MDNDNILRKIQEFKHEFRVDTLRLLNEIVECSIPKNNGVLRMPLNIFKNLLAQVAHEAIRINDDKLHILMIKLGLYELSQDEAIIAIDILRSELELPIPSKQADHLQGDIGFTVPTVLRGNYE